MAVEFRATVLVVSAIKVSADSRVEFAPCLWDERRFLHLPDAVAACNNNIPQRQGF